MMVGHRGLNMTDTQPIESSVSPRKGWLRRWWWRVALAVVLLLLVLVAAAPTLVSSGLGTRLVLSFVNGSIPGTMEIDDLSLGWFSATRVEGLRLRDPDGQVVASVKRIDAGDASLRRVLGAYTKPGVVRIVEPTADVIAYEDGTTNLTRALVKPDDASATADKPDKPARTPKAEPGPRFADVSFRVEIDHARLTYTAPRIETIELLANANADVLNWGEQTLKLDATLRQGGDEGMVAARIKFTDLLDAAMNVRSQQAHVSADVAMKAIPMAAVDRLAGQEGQLLALIGPVLDATLKADGPLGQLAADLVVTSRYLNADAALSVQGDKLAIKPGSKIALTVMPAVVPKLAQPFDVVVLIRELAVEAPGNAPNLESAALDAEIAIGDMGLDAGEPIGRLALRQTRLSVRTQRLADKLTVALNTHADQNGRGGAVTLHADLTQIIKPDGSFNTMPSALIDGGITDLPVAIIDELGKLDGLAVAAVGPVLNATVKGTLAPAGDGRLAGDIVVTAAAAHLDALLAGRVSEDTFTATPDSRVRLVIQPSLVAKALKSEEGQSPSPLALAAPATVTLGVNRLSAPLADFEPGKVTLGAVVTVDQLALAGDPKLAGTAIRDVVVEVPPVRLDQPIIATLKGQLQRQSRAGAIDGSARLTNMLAGEGAVPTATATVALSGVPVELIDALGEQNGKLMALLADAIDKVELAADATLGDSPRYVAAVRITDDRLNGDLNATYTPAGLDVRDGSWASVTIAPDAFAAYNALAAAETKSPPPTLQLVEPMTLRADLKGTMIALGEAGLDPARTRLDARLTSQGLAVRQGHSGESYALRNLDVTVKTTSLKDRLDLTAKAVIPSGVTTGSLASATTLTKLYNDAGEIDLNTLELVTDTTGFISVALLDALLHMEGKLVDTLGETAEAKIAGRFPGDLDMALKSPTASATLKPTISRERTVTLREDAVVMLQVTPRMAKSMLSQAHFVLGEAVASKGPVKLTLSRQPFTVPLDSPDMLREMRLAGTMELGTVEMDRKGFVGGGLDALTNQLLGKLGMSGKPVPTDIYDVTFTPLEFRINNGRVRPTELWMTSPDLAIGFQGDSNIVTGMVNMQMGIMGATLIARTHPNAAQVIQPDRIYEFPVTGLTGEVAALKVGEFIGSLAFGALRQQARGSLGAGVDLIEQGVRDLTRQSGKGLQWTPPPPALQLVSRMKGEQAPEATPAQPLTPEERQQRREERQQQRQEQPQQPQQPAQSPLEQLLEQVVPKEEPAQPVQPAVSEAERARRREERQRQREAERQRQQQQQ